MIIWFKMQKLLKDKLSPQALHPTWPDHLCGSHLGADFLCLFNISASYHRHVQSHTHMHTLSSPLQMVA